MPTFRSGVRLEAENVSGFLRAMGQAQSAIDSFQKAVGRGANLDLSSAGSTAAASFERGLSPLQTIVQGSLLRVGAIATNTVVSAFSAAGRAASESFSDALDFQQAVANIASLADGGVTAAATIGQAIGSIAVDPRLIADTESAGVAFQQLEKQGVATTDILGGVLRSTVQLQNASGMSAGSLTELRDAAEAVGQGLAIFGLNAEQSAGFVDTLAAITTNTKFTLSDLNYLLANSATAINSLGLSYKDVGAVAIATSANFSSARTQMTGLESFLQRLSAPSDEARSALQTLGVSAYDASGNFVGLISLQDQLQAAFNSGIFTTEALQNLLVEGFGAGGAAMATALAKSEELSASLQTLESTSAAAIAAIKTDTSQTALRNLGDVVADLGRRISQPFVDQLAPAIQAASALLSSLAGTFDLLGARIAASLGPVLNFVTQQFNGLAAAIANLTGASVSLPSLGGAAAASTVGAPFAAGRSVTANADASAAGRVQGEQARAQQQIGIDQLNAARSLGGAARSMSQAVEGVLSGVEGLFNLSKVTQEDLDLGGAYKDKADEFVRRLNAAAESGGKEFAETIPQAREALQRIGIVPADDLKALAAQIQQAWADSSLFAAKENIALINEEAIVAAAEAKEKAAEGRANLVAAFGSLVDQLVDGTNAGLSGGGAVSVPAIQPIELPQPDVAQQEQLYNLYQKNIQDVQTAGIEQQSAVSGLVGQVAEMKGQFDIVNGLFGGFNLVLEGLVSTLQGQDFAAAGLTLSTTLSSVIESLTNLAGAADIGTAATNLSTLAQSVLTSASSFADGIDGEAVTTSASALITTVVGKLTEAVIGANLTGLTIAIANYMASVTNLLLEAIRGVKYDEIGLSLGTLISRVTNQLSGAINDPATTTGITTAAATLGGSLTTALTGIREALTSLASSTDVGATTAGLSTFLQTILDSASTFAASIDTAAISNSISGLVITVVGELTTALGEADLTGIATSATGFVSQVAGKLAEAVLNIKFGEIGLAARSLATKAIGQLSGALNDPTVAGNLTTAARALADTVITAITGITSALVDLSANINLAGITSGLGNLATSLVDLAGRKVAAFDGAAFGGDVAAIASNVVKSLSGAIAAVPLAEFGVAAANLVGALAGTFRDAFSMENLAGVGESLGRLVTAIIGQLTATLGDPAFGETLGAAFGDFVVGIVQGAAGLLQGLGQGLDSEVVAGIGGAIGTFVTSFVEGVGSSLASADWSAIGQAIFDGITRAASSLFAGAEGLADAIFAVPFELGKSLEGSTGIASGAGNFFAGIGDRLKADLAAAFDEDAIYTATTALGIVGAGLGLSSSLATAFAKDALYPPELAGGFANIAQSISGAFTSIYDAIAGFFSSLTGILPDWLTGGSSAATPPSAAETEIAKGLAANLATKDDVISLANAVTSPVGADAAGLGGEYGPPLVQATENLVAATTALTTQPVDGAAPLGDREFLTEFAPDTEKAIDGLTKAVNQNTNVYSASGTTDQSGALINPETAQQLTALSTSIPTAGNGFITSLTGATTSTTDFIGPLDEATAATKNLVDATSDQIAATDKVAGSFNTLLDKSDKAATNLGNLNDALSNQTVGQSLEDFTRALDDAINAMNKALDKLGTEAPPPTEPAATTTPKPFARGTQAYPGGLGLGGEENPELYVTPQGRAGLLGLHGPELFTAPLGTVIYPADVTAGILSRGANALGGAIPAALTGYGHLRGIPYRDPGTGGGSRPKPSLAGSSTGTTPVSALLSAPSVTLPPVTIPNEDNSNSNNNNNNNNRNNSSNTNNTSVDPTLFGKFLEKLGKADPTGTIQRASQLVQNAGNGANGSSRSTTQQIADIFTKGLFGGRSDAPQTQVINVNVNNSQDYSTNNYNYNYGGLNMKTAQSTGNLARDFRLLQAISG